METHTQINTHTQHMHIHQHTQHIHTQTHADMHAHTNAHANDIPVHSCSLQGWDLVSDPLHLVWHSLWLC